MNSKIKSRSRYIFTMFLAGSLCGLTNYIQADPDISSDDQVELLDDQSEEPQHRIQITGALNVTLTAIDNAVEILNGGNSTVNLSTVQDNGVPAGTVIVGGTTYTADTNDLTSLSLGVSAMKGTDFNPATDSLKVISDTVGALNLELDGVATLANQESQGTGALATAANLATVDTNVNAILVDTGTSIPGINATTTVITGLDTTYTTGTNNLTALSQGLSSIKGTSYAVATDSLHAISVDIGAPANTGGTVTIAGILGDPGASTGALSIAAAIGNPVGTALSADLLAIQGTTFATGTDSLEAISNNNISVPFATAASLSTTNTTVNTINTNLGDPVVGTVAGNIGSPLVGTVASTLALVLGDPTASTGAASISAAIGNPVGASLSADLLAI